MYYHMILMSTDFSKGKRIAFHKCYEDILKSIEFKEYIEEYKKKFETIKFSFHHVETSRKDYASISEYDSYFKDVKFYIDKAEFEKAIKDSMKLTPEDVVKYILTLGQFDKLQIQKLLYFVYSDYAEDHDEPLFEDCFEAWSYGPVIRRVYHETSEPGYTKISLEDVPLEKIKLKLKLSKIKNKKDVIKSIERTIEQNGIKTGSEMIDETHINGGPWDVARKKGGINSEISWDEVKRYQRNKKIII